VPEYRHHGQAAHATEKRKLANKMLGSFVSTAEARAMFVRASAAVVCGELFDK
jgi:hypothetical protein